MRDSPTADDIFHSQIHRESEECSRNGFRRAPCSLVYPAVKSPTISVFRQDIKFRAKVTDCIIPPWIGKLIWVWFSWRLWYPGHCTFSNNTRVSASACSGSHIGRRQDGCLWRHLATETSDVNIELWFGGSMFSLYVEENAWLGAYNSECIAHNSRVLGSASIIVRFIMNCNGCRLIPSGNMKLEDLPQSHQAILRRTCLDLLDCHIKRLCEFLKGAL